MVPQTFESGLRMQSMSFMIMFSLLWFRITFRRLQNALLYDISSLYIKALYIFGICMVQFFA